MTIRIRHVHTRGVDRVEGSLKQVSMKSQSRVVLIQVFANGPKRHSDQVSCDAAGQLGGREIGV